MGLRLIVKTAYMFTINAVSRVLQPNCNKMLPQMRRCMSEVVGPAVFKRFSDGVVVGAKLRQC